MTLAYLGIRDGLTPDRLAAEKKVDELHRQALIDQTWTHQEFKDWAEAHQELSDAVASQKPSRVDFVAGALVALLAWACSSAFTGLATGFKLGALGVGILLALAQPTSARSLPSAVPKGTVTLLYGKANFGAIYVNSSDEETSLFWRKWPYMLGTLDSVTLELREVGLDELWGIENTNGSSCSYTQGGSSRSEVFFTLRASGNTVCDASAIGLTRQYPLDAYDGTLDNYCESGDLWYDQPTTSGVADSWTTTSSSELATWSDQVGLNTKRTTLVLHGLNPSLSTSPVSHYGVKTGCSGASVFDNLWGRCEVWLYYGVTYNDLTGCP